MWLTFDKRLNKEHAPDFTGDVQSTSDSRERAGKLPDFMVRLKLCFSRSQR